MKRVVIVTLCALIPWLGMAEDFSSGLFLEAGVGSIITIPLNAYGTEEDPLAGLEFNILFPLGESFRIGGGIAYYPLQIVDNLDNSMTEIPQLSLKALYGDPDAFQIGLGMELIINTAFLWSYGEGQNLQLCLHAAFDRFYFSVPLYYQDSPVTAQRLFTGMVFGYQWFLPGAKEESSVPLMGR